MRESEGGPTKGHDRLARVAFLVPGGEAGGSLTVCMSMTQLDGLELYGPTLHLPLQMHQHAIGLGEHLRRS